MNKKGEIDLDAFLKQQEQNKKIPIISGNYKYLTVKEYAELTQRHHTTIIKWLGRGLIEGAVKQRNTWRIPVKN